MSERRTLWLLLALLTGQLLSLAAQVPAAGEQRSTLGAVTLRLVAPVARLVTSGAHGFGALRESLRTRASLRDENEALRAKLEDLELEIERLRNAEEDVRRLSAAVDYARPPQSKMVVADVVYIDHVSWLKTLVVYIGDKTAAVNQPVIAPEGLVGRVVLVSGPYAKVQLITDTTASVGAMVERTRRQGVVRGSRSAPGGLELDWVLLQAPVVPGDRIVTAGIDGVYPRGIPIGTVTDVEPGSELFHRIAVAPAVDFNLLDQVYVLTQTELPDPVKEATPDARP